MAAMLPEALEIGVAAELDGRTLGDGQFDRHLNDVVDLNVVVCRTPGTGAGPNQRAHTRGSAHPGAGSRPRRAGRQRAAAHGDGQRHRRFEADNAAMGPGCSLTQILNKRGFAIRSSRSANNASARRFPPWARPG